MTKKRRKKTSVKTKVVYRTRTIDESPKYRKEIEELEEKKLKVRTAVAEQKKKKGVVGKLLVGLRGVSAQSQINRQIASRRMALDQPRQLGNIKKTIELEKAKQELADIRKRGRVDFGSFCLSGGTKKKELKLEDLY